MKLWSITYYYYDEKSLLVGLLHHHHRKLFNLCWTCVFLKETRTDACFVDLIYHAHFLLSYVLGKDISSLGVLSGFRGPLAMLKTDVRFWHGHLEKKKTYVCRCNFCHLHGSLDGRCKGKIRLYSCSWHLWNNHVCYSHIRLCLEL